MNKSIRSKLFVSIICLLVFFIFGLCILNNSYLEKYYVEKKKNILEENARNLISMYTGNITDIEDELDRTANITGSSIDIRDSSGKIVYTSSRRLPNEKSIKDVNGFKMEPPIDMNNPNHPKPPGDPNVFNGPNNPEDKNEKDSYGEGDYTEGEFNFENRRDIKLNIDFLALVTKLNDGHILIIKVPLLSINESVDIANKFIIITGFIIVILGSIWAYVFAKKFTRPILEVNNVARNMAKFDFGKKCSIKGKDEIGQLGQSINYLSTELDKAITELNEKNKKLERDIERERKIDEMRKEFISSVSHELRTPLSVMQGYAEGLVSNVAESDEDRAFYCEVIMNEVNKMNKLVKDLLNLSQIESGYFHIENSEFNITSLIEYVISKYKGIFDEKDIKIHFETGENLIAFGDMVRIEQVFTNYLNNAINHIADDKIIKVTKEVNKDKIKISVFNTGKHIPAESLEKIWTSFYKVDKARTRAYGGYGLGLSIVKALQELSYNGYGVENVEGGVVFWFEVNKVNLNL